MSQFGDWAKRVMQGLRPVFTSGCCVVLAFLLMGFGATSLKLKDLHITPCPDTPEYSNMVTSTANPMAARCLFIEGTVVNPSKNTLVNADVFGRLYDANGNDVMPERTRLGAIEEVPPGETPFSIRISVPVTNPLPLKMEQFKASGFSGVVRR
ncbi:MAG: FxLYD domain-containing protein [Cyanobacteriota bacterium]